MLYCLDVLHHCTPTPYRTTCPSSVHQADVVVVDFAVNDRYPVFGPPFLNEPRRAFERLVRKLLSYPNRPAVVLLHAYAWNQVTWGGGRGGCQRIGGGRVGRGSGTV